MNIPVCSSFPHLCLFPEVNTAWNFVFIIPLFHQIHVCVYKYTHIFIHIYILRLICFWGHDKISMVYVILSDLLFLMKLCLSDSSKLMNITIFYCCIIFCKYCLFNLFTILSNIWVIGRFIFCYYNQCNYEYFCISLDMCARISFLEWNFWLLGTCTINFIKHCWFFSKWFYQVARPQAKHNGS